MGIEQDEESIKFEIQNVGALMGYGVGGYSYKTLFKDDYYLIKYCPDYNFLMIITTGLRLHAPIELLKKSDNTEFIEVPGGAGSSFGWKGSEEVREKSIFLNGTVYVPEKVAEEFIQDNEDLPEWSETWGKFFNENNESKYEHHKQIKAMLRDQLVENK